MNNVFKFQGIDAKTEWRIGLLAGIPGLFVFLGTLFLLESVFGLNFIVSIMTAAGLTLSVVLIVLKQLSKLGKNKIWTISIENHNVKISFQNQIWNFRLNEIRIIKNMGNVGFRYLTIITQTEKIKIRVGNTGFVPFSTQEDLQTLDEFITYLKPYIDENFNKKILKNRIDNHVFPNCGIYVVKTEKIRYSLINKMNPAQVIIVFGLAGFLFIMLLMFFILNIIDK